MTREEILLLTPDPVTMKGFDNNAYGQNYATGGGGGGFMNNSQSSPGGATKVRPTQSSPKHLI